MATLDPFHGYKNAIDDQLQDAVAVLDAFLVVKLGTQAVDDVRRRVQQDTTGHRGRKGDRSTGSATPCAREQRTSQTGNAPASQYHTLPTNATTRSTSPTNARNACSAYHQHQPGDGQRIAEQIVAAFPSCPIPEIARLGRTLRQWKAAFLSYFDTGGANNCGTVAINGSIELHRRIARGFRNRANYRLRMLLIAAGLNIPSHDPTAGTKSPISGHVPPPLAPARRYVACPSHSVPQKWLTQYPAAP